MRAFTKHAGKRIEVVVSTRRAVSAALESAYPEDLGSLVEELPDSLSLPAPDDPMMDRIERIRELYEAPLDWLKETPACRL